MDALNIPIRGGTIESGSMTATNTFVRDTEAISFYSEHLAKHYVRLGMVKILPISTSVLTSPIGVAWSKHTEVSAATQLLIDNLVLVARSLVGPAGTGKTTTLRATSSAFGRRNPSGWPSCGPCRVRSIGHYQSTTQV